MKKVFIFSAFVLINVGLAAQSVRLEALAPFAYDWSGYSGYEAGSASADLSAVRAGGGFSFLMPRPGKGPLSLLAGLAASYEYMTDFVPDAVNAITDHAILIIGLQGRVELSILPWLDAYALGELDFANVSVFSALHPYYGTEDSAGGAQAAMGLSITPFRWKMGNTSLAAALSPRVTVRGLLLANVVFWSFGAGMDLGLRWSL